MDKKLRKRIDRCCKICGESDYNVLDVHRIIEGNKGGKYSVNNCVTICCKCHRLVHAGKIKIHSWRMSTKGMVLWCEIEGKEMYL